MSEETNDSIEKLDQDIEKLGEEFLKDMEELVERAAEKRYKLEPEDEFTNLVMPGVGLNCIIINTRRQPKDGDLVFAVSDNRHLLGMLQKIDGEWFVGGSESNGVPLHDVLFIEGVVTVMGRIDSNTPDDGRDWVKLGENII